jgi:hypothetical protein
MRDPEKIAAYTAKAQEHYDAFFADGRTLPYDYTSGPITARIHSVTIVEEAGRYQPGDLVVIVGLFVNGQEIACPDRSGPTNNCQEWVVANAPLEVPDPEGPIEKADGSRWREDPLAIQRGGLADLVAQVMGAL